MFLGGLPATGKSTLAAGLALRSAERGEPWVLLRSDVVRKELAFLPPRASAEAAYGEGSYDAATTEATYGELLRRAGRALESGESVILDASWSRERHRAAARSLGHCLVAPVQEVQATCPAPLSADRLRQRRTCGTDASDATVAVLEAMASAFEPWPDAAPLDSSQSLAGSDERAWPRCSGGEPRSGPGRGLFDEYFAELGHQTAPGPLFGGGLPALVDGRPRVDGLVNVLASSGLAVPSSRAGDGPEKKTPRP